MQTMFLHWQGISYTQSTLQYGVQYGVTPRGRLTSAEPAAAERAKVDYTRSRLVDDEYAP
jgi:hypothetical protein